MLITIVEEEKPTAYSTAFVFLSLYGMVRNFTMVLLISYIWILISALLGQPKIWMAVWHAAGIIVFYLQYDKFRKLFISKICQAFVVMLPYQKPTNINGDIGKRKITV